MRLPELSPSAYRRVTTLALWALVGIVVTGAAVRLTGSGLGCSDWPTCEDNQVVAPLEFHAWMEFGNRLLTGVVSLAVILAVLGSLRRVPRRRDLTWLSVGLVAGVLAQIVLGGLVVWSHLNPVLVQSHFLVSQLLVLDAVVLRHRAGRPRGPSRPLVPAEVVGWSRALIALTVAVMVAGTVVTGAGPHSGEVEGDFVERLGVDVGAAARVHGILAMVLLATVLATVWRLHRTGAPATVMAAAETVLVVLVLQGAIGYLQYFTEVPPLLVGLHVLGATLLWVVVLRFGLTLSQPVADTRESGRDDRPVTAIGSEGSRTHDPGGSAIGDLVTN